jgi:hypothetical protein
VEARSSCETYEVRSGRHIVGVAEANTPYEAVADYLRALGCTRDELMRMGSDAIAWRGAVYRAVRVDTGASERRAAA